MTTTRWTTDASTPGAGVAVTVTDERLFTTWVTSLDRIDHAVTDEEYAVRLFENRGVFVAVCGTEFLPGPMESAPGPPCLRCMKSLDANKAASQRPLEPSEPPKKVRTRRSRFARPMSGTS